MHVEKTYFMSKKMFRAEKPMFRAEDGFLLELFDRLNTQGYSLNYPTENGGLEMKKLLLLTMVLILSLSLVACGGDADSGSSDADTPDPIDLVEMAGNGLALALPSDIEYVQTDENSGTMLFSNEERNVVVSLGAKTEDPLASADVTDDVLFGAISGNGQLDATLDRSGTIEQDGGTSVVGFGIATLADGTVMNSVVQYFFPADGSGYHVISYLYAVDAETSLDDTIEEVLSTVIPVE